MTSNWNFNRKTREKVFSDPQYLHRDSMLFKKGLAFYNKAYFKELLDSARIAINLKDNIDLIN